MQPDCRFHFPTTGAECGINDGSGQDVAGGRGFQIMILGRLEGGSRMITTATTDNDPKIIIWKPISDSA